MIKVDGEEIKVLHYPDGTQKINVLNYLVKQQVYWRYDCEEELVTLIYVVRHFKNRGYADLSLKMPYLPNARMDRTHDNTEVFTLKYFADVINWIGFEHVEIIDAHSNVGIALLNNVVCHDPSLIISKIRCKFDIIYFPDEGAYKRYSRMFPNVHYCYGEKTRDWETGKILGLDIKTNGEDLKGKSILMIDDIISYGGSLYYSALELKKRGVDKIYAYATHTENSILDKEKGTLIKLLENGTVDKLYTTNSLFTGTHEKIEVMEV